MPNRSSMGAQRKLSGLMILKIGFLFANSNIDPTAAIATIAEDRR